MSDDDGATCGSPTPRAGRAPITTARALAGPLLMLPYGIVRWIDNQGGQLRGGPVWVLANVAFAVAIVALVLVAVELRRMAGGGRVATVALGSTFGGAAAYLWIIAGEMLPGLRAPDALLGVLDILGPVLFPKGVLTLLVLLVLARRLPVWSPILALAGFVAMAVTLDLVPLAALLVGAGLVALVGTPRRPGLPWRASTRDATDVMTPG